MIEEEDVDCVAVDTTFQFVLNGVEDRQRVTDVNAPRNTNNLSLDGERFSRADTMPESTKHLIIFNDLRLFALSLNPHIIQTWLDKTISNSEVMD